MKSSGLVSLRKSLSPLKEVFNREGERERFIVILSPTSESCLEGARAVRQSIIARNPIPGLAIFVVWIDLLPRDNSFSAGTSAKAYFADTQAIQFHDPERRVGKAFAAALGADKDKVVWDFFMFFAAGDSWEKKAPVPKAYLHQLKGSSWADEEQFRSGRDLFDALYRMASEESR
jgi:hypothetical protein